MGFGMRGPGCGAPSRYVDVNRFMEWIDIMVTSVSSEDHSGRRALYVQRQSAVELKLYPGIIIYISKCNKHFPDLIAQHVIIIFYPAYY